MSELLTELFLASLVFDLLSATLRTQMFFVIKLFNYYSTKYEDPRGVAKGGVGGCGTPQLLVFRLIKNL